MTACLYSVHMEGLYFVHKETLDFAHKKVLYTKACCNLFMMKGSALIGALNERFRY
jgi:hypothetical protein